MNYLPVIFGLLLGAGIFFLLGGVFVVVVSLVRHTKISAGLTALAWAALIAGVVTVLTLGVPSSSATGARIVLGAIPVFLIARRDGYHAGAGWFWLLFPGIGWWLLLWSRNNQLDEARMSVPDRPSPWPTSPIV